MKLGLALAGNRIDYRIETVVKLSDKMKELYKIVEVGFSPNPFDPVTAYLVSRVEPNFQHLIDSILDAEVNQK